MTNTIERKFVVFFMIPAATMDAWSNTDPAIKAASEADLKAQITKWTAEHASRILSSEAGGKTKQVTANQVSDIRNDIVMFSIVAGTSHDDVTALFKSHPHLQIPNASIQVMELRTVDWS
jgi:hypothetical protein